MLQTLGDFAGVRSKTGLEVLDVYSYPLERKNNKIQYMCFEARLNNSVDSGSERYKQS